MEDSIRKDLNWAKALSLFEGVCFFMAGICALLSGSILGYISGGLLIILGCMSIFPVFFGGDGYWVNLGMSLAKDEGLEEYGERIEEEKQHENEDV